MSKEKWTGIVFNEDGVGACDKCGGNKVKQTMHLDFEKSFATQYLCSGCGNEITCSAEREEAMA